MLSSLFFIDFCSGLTEGIKIDDSPRKDNSANSTIEDEDRRKQNGGVVTKFSAKKGFTLSHEDLVGATAAAATQKTESGGQTSAVHLDVRGGHHERSSSNIEKSDTFNAFGLLRPKSRNSSVVEPPGHEQLVTAATHNHSGSSIKSKMGQLQSNLSLLNLNLSGGGGILSKKKSLGSRSSHSSTDTSRLVDTTRAG